MSDTLKETHKSNIKNGIILGLAGLAIAASCTVGSYGIEHLAQPFLTSIKEEVYKKQEAPYFDNLHTSSLDGALYVCFKDNSTEGMQAFLKINAIDAYLNPKTQRVVNEYYSFWGMTDRMTKPSPQELDDYDMKLFAFYIKPTRSCFDIPDFVTHLLGPFAFYAVDFDGNVSDLKIFSKKDGKIDERKGPWPQKPLKVI